MREMGYLCPTLDLGKLKLVQYKRKIIIRNLIFCYCSNVIMKDEVFVRTVWQTKFLYKSLIDQERKKALSFPFKRILHYLLHTLAIFSPQSLQCNFHTAARVFFLKHNFKTWLLSSFSGWSSNSSAALAFPHTIYLSTLLCFCSCRNDMTFSPICNLSKFYLPIKVRHNGHLLDEASLNSSCHDCSFLFDLCHLAGSN